MREMARPTSFHIRTCIFPSVMESVQATATSVTGDRQFG
jgi:hypothetical protein